jgi:hypothetical protein
MLNMFIRASDSRSGVQPSFSDTKQCPEAVKIGLILTIIAIVGAAFLTFSLLLAIQPLSTARFIKKLHRRLTHFHISRTEAGETA